ncbi:hypothetical protein [Variovorax soli]|uniref:Polyferredoxin n=1 Tax=Variovorax soli TaxID=376815 RepID=A0ABU1NFG0_9BURK|nr:hypothetical protein [Variovorax soli]MDR6537207.1 polyferredoxin [Variovorax soli]
MGNSPDKLMLLIRAMVVMLALGFVLIEISQWFLPFVSPWEFVVSYVVGSAIAFLLVVLGIFAVSVWRTLFR